MVVLEKGMPLSKSCTVIVCMCVCVCVCVCLCLGLAHTNSVHFYVTIISFIPISDWSLRCHVVQSHTCTGAADVLSDVVIRDYGE